VKNVLNAVLNVRCYYTTQHSQSVEVVPETARSMEVKYFQKKNTKIYLLKRECFSSVYFPCFCKEGLFVAFLCIRHFIIMYPEFSVVLGQTIVSAEVYL